MPVLAAIEAGGTTWVAALVSSDDLGSPYDRLEVPTTDPASTITSIRDWLREKVNSNSGLAGVGIASFGPIDGKVDSATYGFITTTPKPGWMNTDVVGLLGLRDEFQNIPFKFDTDVNAPALAEFELHNLPGATSSAYVTVGTGIGIGFVINGKTVHGLVHPEGGHIQVAIMEGDTFEGTCPFHKSCIEGMCSSGALAARALCQPSELASLPDDHIVWDQCAYYLAQLATTMVLIASPERIVFGGGVLKRTCLYGKIRTKVKELLQNYIQNPALTTDEGLETYICPSFWGNEAGVVGAAYLAMNAMKGGVDNNEM